jgi:Ni/Co efflux regulator RcnB
MNVPVTYISEPYYVDYTRYSLTPPPYGYRWVRIGTDAYLVSTNTGVVSEVNYDFFH